MNDGSTAPRPRALDRARLARLLEMLVADGYALIGPTLRDGAIVLDEIGGLADLPAGWTEVQDAGRYRLERRDDDALFGHASGPRSFKRFFHVPEERLFRSHREGRAVAFEAAPPEPRRLALIGARGCDLAALAALDRVLLGGPFADERYALRRADVLVIAVHCASAGGTCFCASMGTGPRAGSGHDLALTELTGEDPAFVVEIGSERGRALLDRVGSGPAEAEAVERASAAVERTARSMGRALEGSDVAALLAGHPESPRWQEVAKRCLSCGNCTMVCPTCFCGTVDDRTDLTGEHAERWRRWDSCFTMDFSYLHGGSVRASTAARYRQWLTHKLSTWHEQFGSSGCVGCGRCITWCPTGIDLTEEVRAIRAAEERS